MLSAWQTIISRNIDAEERAVLSACSINAGNSWNVIPDSAVIRGNVRALSEEERQLIEKRFLTLTENIAEAFGAEVEINYRIAVPQVMSMTASKHNLLVTWQTPFLAQIECFERYHPIWVLKTLPLCHKKGRAAI